ncbi:MAG: nucleotidyltransferase domain-containing protein [Gammaproteobacteria bacterium]|nr:nucleotidyltransferase domain-containing protein [Gammaproteobacteria bacterium]
MRLTREQIQKILAVTYRYLDDRGEVFLFGSRLDDQARGGDVDLLIESDRHLSLLERGRIKLDLEADLGLPVDIVVYERGHSATPFQVLARANAERLVRPE